MENDYYIREKGRAPVKNKCNSNLLDDGRNCVDNTTCIRVACDDPKGCVKCLDPIKVPLEERLLCGKDEEKINNMCYKKCKTGYVGDEEKCYKGVDDMLIKKLTDTDNEGKNLEDPSNSFNFFDYILDCLTWIIKKIKYIYHSLGTYRFYIVVLLIILIYYYFFMNKISHNNMKLSNNKFSNRFNENIMRQLLSDNYTETDIEFIIIK